MPTHPEDAPFELEHDIFFLPDQVPIPASDADPSIMYVDYPTTDSTSSTWTENLNTSDISWSSSSIYPPIQESSAEISLDDGVHSLSTDTTLVDVQSLSNHAHYTNSEDIEALIQPRPAHHLLNDAATEFSVQETMDEWPVAQPLETHIQPSEDPFMGWASKRASHLFADYGWVLSHVETL
jgi:hypothetical protein